MRIDTSSPSSSYALAPVKARTPLRDDARPAPQQQARARAGNGAESVRVANATPSPGLTLRGRLAQAAYTQLDVMEQRAQFTQLVGVDVYA